MQEETPWCSHHLLKMLNSLCRAQCKRRSVLVVSLSRACRVQYLWVQVGLLTGCDWLCVVCGQASCTWAEKCVGRRQRPAGLIVWRLLFQSHVHTALADPTLCVWSPRHATNIFPFLSVFPSARLWPPSLMSPSLYLNVFHNHFPLSDISLF